MTNEMSASAIEARLEALGGLYVLGLSLAEIAGPTLPRSVFWNRTLVIEGRVSAATRAAVGLAVADERDVSVFLVYAGKRHVVGDEFELIVDHDATRVIAATRCILVAVTQQFSQPWDELPAGWQTIAVLRFVEGVPSTISNLPEHDTWGLAPACRLVKAADWRRRPEGSP